MKLELRKVRKIIDRVKKQYHEKTAKDINVAFVGCGKHATENLYPALKYANMNLTAVCSKHLHNAEKQAALFGAETAYDDYREMLDNEKIDALLVCVNANMHYEISIEALKRDIPVFVEKPPASNVEQANELLELSQKQEKFLMVGFNKRFGIIYKEAKRMIEKGEINEINLITIRAYVGEMNNAETLLADVGIHYIDLLHYFGGAIKDFHTKKYTNKNNTTFVIICEFANETIGVLQLSSLYSWSKPGEKIEILGKESLLILEDGQKITYHKPTIASPGELPVESEKSTIWSPNYSIPVKENHLIFINGYVYELRHFADAIRRKEKALFNMGNGYKALSVIGEILKQK